MVLELAAVVAMSVLMLYWMRVNRGRIELAEAHATRQAVFELTSPPGTVKIPSKSRRGSDTSTNNAA